MRGRGVIHRRSTQKLHNVHPDHPDKSGDRFGVLTQDKRTVVRAVGPRVEE